MLDEQPKTVVARRDGRLRLGMRGKRMRRNRTNWIRYSYGFHFFRLFRLLVVEFKLKLHII